MKTVATWIREEDKDYFEAAFSPYPEISLANARLGKVPWSEVSGLLLTGGSDISEHYLRQPVPDPLIIEDPDTARDEWEFKVLAQALEQQLPVLGICRGLQVLNVSLGGTLSLDIPSHNEARSENVQELRYATHAQICFPKVNSSHHQAILQLGKGLVVEAWSVKDEVIEQIRLQRYPFALGVQYHPERHAQYQLLFECFVGHVLRYESR